MRPACTPVTPSRLCPVCERPLKKNIGSRPMPRSCEPQLYWRARPHWSIRQPQSWSNWLVDSWSEVIPHGLAWISHKRYLNELCSHLNLVQGVRVDGGPKNRVPGQGAFLGLRHGRQQNQGKHEKKDESSQFHLRTCADWVPGPILRRVP